MLTYATARLADSDERIKDDAERYAHMPNSAGSPPHLGARKISIYWMASVDAEIAFLR